MKSGLRPILLQNVAKEYAIPELQYNSFQIYNMIALVQEFAIRIAISSNYPIRIAILSLFAIQGKVITKLLVTQYYKIKN